MGLLAGCASKPVVQTRTIHVDRPVSVPLPMALTAGVSEPALPLAATNDDLVGYAEGARCRLILANCQLERIEALQPMGARREAMWCQRYVEVCRGGK